MKITSWLLLIFFSMAAACTSRLNRQQDEQYTAEQFDSLRQVYYDLYDSLSMSWATMIEDDDQKLANMELLLSELKAQTATPADSIDSLMQMVQQLREVRYDSSTLRESDRIDRYDSITSEVSEAILSYTDSLAEEEISPVINVLRSKIVSANNSVLLYRIRYDRFTEDFNRFLEQYKNVMAEIDSADLNAQKQPMFRLINDIDKKEKNRKP